MSRIEVNVTTGERRVVPLTAEEIEAGEQISAAESIKAAIRSIEVESPFSRKQREQMIANSEGKLLAWLQGIEARIEVEREKLR